MFNELAPLLKDPTDTLLLSVSRLDDGQLRVTVTPHLAKKSTDAPAALSAPLCVTGTPEELDRDLPGALGQYREQRQSAAAALAALEAQFEQAKKDADARVASEKKRGQATPWCAGICRMTPVAFTTTQTWNSNAAN